MKSNKKYLTLVALSIFAIGCGVVAGAFFGLTHDLPQILELNSFVPSAVTRIYSSDDVILSELFVEKRKPVPLKRIPHFLKAGIIVTEDRSFYKHSGVDLKGILRAIIRDIRAGEFAEGASTITQQLAKTLFLTPKKSLSRKIKEAILAFQIERRYTKDEILTLYLNQIYLGSGAYGVESAANIFFGKHAEDLDLAECALIAAMPKAPSRYSPLVNKDLAERRRNIVLGQMLETGFIQEQDYQDAIHTPVSTNAKRSTFIKAPYFVDYIKKDLERNLGPALLYKGGMTVYSTLSFEMQTAAEEAVQKGLLSMESGMLQDGAKASPLQAALIALKAETGEILAMVGGRDYSQSSYNRGTTAKRQPGSAFKPIIYAWAIENGFSQNRMILDAPIIFNNAQNGNDWQPENFSKTYLGEITLRKALALSKNIPAVRLIQMLGPSTVVQFAHRLGIESSLSPDLSLALGTSEVRLLELITAYAVFPNGGNAVKPYGIMEAIDARGRPIWQHRPCKKVAMSQWGASIVTDMLKAVVQEGTGKRARVLKRPVAGKTGTTDSFKDALFIGFSPEIAVGVWVGRDTSEPLGDGETGSKAALPIWTDFMSQALKDQPFQYFDIPDSVSQMHMDPVTGHLTTVESPNTVTVLVKKGFLSP